ncbi:MAG TPA: NAD-dependent epimerase/dehydratase family protein [Candidatus Binatia bacterium]|nr:NAD-dependent epimerase/dehydratase family protein [Candidatus Binatia bacterium]
MRSALVTGGAGFLGTHVAARLARDGWRVRATVHRRPPGLRVPGVEYVRADLTRPEDCRRVVAGVERVVMCAAATSGAAVMVATPLAHVTPNVVMNAQMLDAAWTAGVDQFVFVSSSAAYPPTGDRPVAEDEMLAGDPPPVYHAVGWMKRYAEILCELYARRLPRRMRATVVRPSNVYGPWDKFDPATSHVTAALVRRVVARERPLVVWGTGDDVRDLIYVDDFVEGLVRAAEATEDFLAVNVAAGEGHRVRDVLAALLALDGFADADVRFDPTKPATVPIRLVDTRRARERLGFTATTPLATGLARTLAWYRAHRETRDAFEDAHAAPPG